MAKLSQETISLTDARNDIYIYADSHGPYTHYVLFGLNSRTHYAINYQGIQLDDDTAGI